MIPTIVNISAAIFVIASTTAALIITVYMVFFLIVNVVVHSNNINITRSVFPVCPVAGARAGVRD